MPENSPLVKINAVRRFGGDFVSIKLIGSNFDMAYTVKFNFYF